jgi:hypothetical protein
MRLSDPKHFDHILPFLQHADAQYSIPLNSDDINRMHATDDAATFEEGRHDMQTHTAGELSDTGEHTATSIAKAPRAFSARMYAVRVRDAGECDAASAADMPRITCARTYAVETSPFTDSGEQARVQQKDSAKAPPQHLSLKNHKHIKHVRGYGTDLRVMASHAYSYKKFWMTVGLAANRRMSCLSSRGTSLADSSARMKAR